MAISFTGRSSNVGITGVNISGATITDITIEESFGSIVKAKDGKGTVVGLLMSKGQKTLQASGYAATGNAIALQTQVTAPEFSGNVIESSIEMTGDDFTKLSITALEI